MQRVKRSTAVAALPAMPAGGSPGYFASPNPGGGVPATIPGYEWFNSVQEELCGLVTAAGLALDINDSAQLLTALVKRGLQGSYFNIAAATGTADAITGAFAPAIAALTNGMTLCIRAGSANATSTPTFKADGTTAKTIVKGNNLPLVAGDIAGAGHWVELCYDLALDKWVIANPAKGVSGGEKQIQSVSATVAANALTLGLNPTTLDFRAASLTNGVPNTRTVAAALSLVVPSGATLGTTAAITYRLVLLAIDNAGTVELAVVNLAGGVNLDETTLISTTAIDAASDSAGVIYSTVARASVPFRVVGMIDIAETVAGTWATAPTTIQGHGGQALAALQSLGFGQTQQVLTGSRSLGTTYYNTTGRPIWIEVYAFLGATQVVQLIKNGVTVQNVGNNTTTSTNYAVSTIVLPGQSYSVTASGGPSYVWTETR